MIRIRKPRRGETISAEFIASLIDAINERDLLDCPSGSSGLRLLNTPQGRIPKVTALGGGRAAVPNTPPFTILDASAPDADGTPNPGRVRIVNGLLGGLQPDEMTLGDTVLPDGTDNHCYLIAQSGTNYVYGKVLVDSDTGLYTSADVYVVDSPEEGDGTYAYLQIGTVQYDDTLTIYQATTGNQSLLVFASADGSMLQPAWST